MEKSRTATSGCDSVASFSADGPSPASATTDMSGCASTSAFSPARTTAWSSANSTRIVFTVLSLVILARERHPDEHRRPLPRVGLDLERPADERRPFLHAEKSQFVFGTGRFANRLRIEAAAVVLHYHQQVIAAAFQDHAHATRRGVLAHVGERLHHDPVQVRLDVRRQT